MLKLRFTQCQTEHTVFYNYKDEDALIVAVDVDDLMMAGSMQHIMARFKRKLSSHYNIKDLGELQWLLGIESKDFVRNDLSRSHKRHVLNIYSPSSSYMMQHCF